MLGDDSIEMVSSSINDIDSHIEMSSDPDNIPANSSTVHGDDDDRNEGKTTMIDV